MRLLKTDVFPPVVQEVLETAPPISYAILSHTWADGEVSFQEISEQPELARLKPGYAKLVQSCKQAKDRGFDYLWMDTCCIDKRNSAELSEAINSMYRYYEQATECFIYLGDVHPSKDRHVQLSSLKSSRWLSRGWTLQELLASTTRLFFASDWSLMEHGDDLLSLVSSVTRIDKRVLHDKRLIGTFCVAERMSWVSRRMTTRDEDMAYCLMGIFNVSMPIIYGEGLKKAFRRLQTLIIQKSFDQTIFVWRGNYSTSGLLADGPADFAHTPELAIWAPRYLSPFSMTNVGVSIRVMDLSNARVKVSSVSALQSGSCHTESGPTHESRVQMACPSTSAHEAPGSNGVFLAAIQCDIKVAGCWNALAVYLEPVRRVNLELALGAGRVRACRRIRCDEWYVVPEGGLSGAVFEDLVVFQDEHYELASRAFASDLLRWNGQWPGIEKVPSSAIRERGKI